MANVNITKKAIQEAFAAVLDEKPFGKITVKDITDRCGISRNTFYYHYQDIPALLEEICQNQVEDIISKYPTLNSIEDCLDAAMQSVLETSVRLCIFITLIIATLMSSPCGACARRP